MKRLWLLLVLPLVACSPKTEVLHAPDPVRGAQMFAPCANCHALDPGRTIFGPSLYGVYGRKAGTLPGYDYSPAMKAYGKVWDETTLDAFLTSPQKTVKGTRMGFWGFSKAQDRRDLIAYLKQKR